MENDNNTPGSFFKVDYYLKYSILVVCYLLCMFELLLSFLDRLLLLLKLLVQVLHCLVVGLWHCALMVAEDGNSPVRSVVAQHLGGQVILLRLES